MVMNDFYDPRIPALLIVIVWCAIIIGIEIVFYFF